MKLQRPHEIVLYRCPKCSGYMEAIGYYFGDYSNYDWKCTKCKGIFRLTFKEVKKNAM